MHRDHPGQRHARAGGQADDVQHRRRVLCYRFDLLPHSAERLPICAADISGGGAKQEKSSRCDGVIVNNRLIDRIFFAKYLIFPEKRLQ